MTRFTIRTLLALTLVGALTVSAQAKDPFNQLADIIGSKWVQITKKPTLKKDFSFKKNTSKKYGSWSAVKSYKALEFFATSGEDLLAIEGYQAARVQVDGYGSGNFMWEIDGDVYEIANYPWDNNHKPVSGIVHHPDGTWSSFKLIHRKVSSSPVAGRWSGELAFLGGGYLRFALQVANQPGKCGSQSAYTRIDFLGFPSQPASLSCTDGGTYYSQFFFWNEAVDGVFFLTITGEVTEDGDIFQGQATAWDLYGGDQAQGKFLLFRPQGLVL